MIAAVALAITGLAAVMAVAGKVWTRLGASDRD